MFVQTIKRKYLSVIAVFYRYWQWRRTISLTVLITFFSSTVSPALAADPATVTKNKTSSNKVSAIKENTKITKAKQKKLSSYKPVVKFKANSDIKSKNKNFTPSNEYKPYLEFGGARYFNQASNVAGIYDLFIPLLQNSEQLLFTNLRIFDRSGSAAEGNFHLGYRKLIDPKQMFGIYGAFDYKRSDERNSFHQLTLGLEYWHDKWFAGANIYKPLGATKKYVGETTSQHELLNSSRNIVETKTINKLYEEALPGIDAELGFALTENLTSYVGGYYFAASGAETVTGPKVRITYDYLQPIGRILGIVDGISVEAGAQHDKPRGNTAYIGLRFKVGLTNLAKNSNISGFKRHMVELVRRDPDIVIGKTQETSEKYYQKKYYQEGEHGFIGGNANPDRPYSERTDYENWPQEILLKELGLPEHATYAEIGKAYREKSLMHHPDKTKRSWDNHARVNGAYTELKNRHHAEKIKNQVDQQKTTASQGVILNLPTATTIAGGNSYKYYGGGDLKNSKTKNETPNFKNLTSPDYKYSNFDVERLLAYRLLESKDTITAKELPLTVISPLSQTELSFSHNPQLFNAWLKQELTTQQQQIILPVYLDKEEHWISVVFAKKNDSALEVKYFDSLATQENSHGWLTQLLKNSYDGKINFVQEKLLQQSENSVGCGAFAVENALRGLNLFTNNINAKQNETDIRNLHQSLLNKYKNQKIPNQGIVSFIDINAILPIGISISRSRVMRGGRRLKGDKNRSDEPIDQKVSSNVLKNPVLVGSLKTDGSAEGVVVVGDYAYVADYDKGLKIINIKTQVAPVLVGRLDTNDTAYDVVVVGDYAYVADAGSGLKIINIATPAAPVLVGSLDTDGHALGVAVAGDYAYVGDTQDGFKIINISTPAAPVLVGSLDTDGHALGVAIAGDYAYVADYTAGLKIINIATPVTPVLVGRLKTDGYARRVVTVEDYAYVADWSGGLKIINIAIKTTPVLVGGLDIGGVTLGVAVAGDYAYMTDTGGRFKIIDIVASATPVLVGSLNVGGQGSGIAVVSNYAYMADGTGGLKIIRVLENAPVVSDLYKSVITDTTVTFSEKDFTEKYSDADNDPLTKIQITSLPSNGTLKLSETAITVNQEIAVEDLENITFAPESKWHGESSFGWQGFDGFEYSVDAADVNMIIDTPPVVSDISKSGPRDQAVTFSATDFTSKFTDVDGDSLTKSQITSLPSNGVLKLSDTAVTVNQEIVVGNLNYLTFEPESKWHGKSNFGWKGNDGFEYSTSGAKVDLFIDTPPVVSDLYKSVTENTTVIFSAKDFSDKFSDVEGGSLTQIKVTSLPSDGTLKLSGVAVTVDQEIVVEDLGNLTFEPKSNWTGDSSFNWKGRHDEFAYSVDAADVNISVVATVSPVLVSSLETGSIADGVVIAGEYAYVTDRYKGLKVISIKTKTSPVLVGSLGINGSAYGLTVVGDYAYVAALDGGLKIINIVTPSLPALVGGLDTDGFAYGVTVVGDYAYVADKNKGLKIINIISPSSPFLIGSLDTDGDARGVAVVGKYAYVADWTSGLKIIDIVNKKSPVLVGSLDTDGSAYDVVVVGNYAYVADWDRGLKIINVATPETPVLTGSLATDGRAIGIEIVGDYAYIADDVSGGLKIINIEPDNHLADPVAAK